MIPVLHSTYALFFSFVQNCFVAWFLADLSKSVVKMHIKSVILEGFKSYAQRTEVNGFDPLFNAITGLNGSGKSNILDSICFLLGISNLSQVKCKLSDLCGFKFEEPQGNFCTWRVPVLPIFSSFAFLCELSSTSLQSFKGRYYYSIFKVRT